MDEIKVLGDNMIRTRLQGGTPFFPNMLNNGKVEVCLKEDVDAALAEKDSETRRLKRALWLSRAESAKNAMCRYYRLALKEECDPQPHGWSCYINGEVYPTGKMSRKLEPHYWFDVWEEVERKCRAKAEEYK